MSNIRQTHSYTIIDPNRPQDVMRTLRKILIEKLLSQPMENTEIA